MSDPRLQRDPNRPASPYTNRESTAGTGSMWVAAIVAILVILGVAAYSYRGTHTASNPSATTSGQSTRTPDAAPPVSAPPTSAAPANPAQRP
jgi:hypothetical protein